MGSFNVVLGVLYTLCSWRYAWLCGGIGKLHDLTRNPQNSNSCVFRTSVWSIRLISLPPQGGNVHTNLLYFESLARLPLCTLNKVLNTYRSILIHLHYLLLFVIRTFEDLTYASHGVQLEQEGQSFLLLLLKFFSFSYFYHERWSQFTQKGSENTVRGSRGTSNAN